VGKHASVPGRPGGPVHRARGLRQWSRPTASVVLNRRASQPGLASTAGDTTRERPGPQGPGLGGATPI
jgi:hypothetical protein